MALQPWAVHGAGHSTRRFAVPIMQDFAWQHDILTGVQGGHGRRAQEDADRDLGPAGQPGGMYALHGTSGKLRH